MINHHHNVYKTQPVTSKICPFISLDEVVKSLSEFEFDNSKIDISSPMTTDLHITEVREILTEAE